MPQIKILKGTYDPDAITAMNSLYANHLIYPEIATDLLMLQPQYSLTNITAPFTEADVEGIGDKKFEFPVIGRLDRPLTMTGTAPVGDGSGDGIVYIEVEEDYARPTWEYKIGTRLVRANDYGVKTATGYRVPFKIMSGDSTDVIDSADVYRGRRMGKVANSNVEYSEKGYGAQNYPDWLANYTTISRAAKHITGDAASSILWLQKGNNKNSRMWMIGSSPQEFMNQFGGMDGGFLWEMEKDAWFGTTTMNSDGICIKTDKDGKPIIRGNGFLQQISSSMTDEFYKGTINRSKILDFIMNFKISAGISKGKITVHTGAGGMKAWYEALANDYLHNGNNGIMYTMDSGRQVIVGEDIKTVHLLGCDITVFENPVLTDPLNNDTDDEGLSLLGQSYFFVDGNMSYSDTGKMIPTVQRKVKRANGIDRRLICKIVDGMINPIEPMKIFSSNARDGYSAEWLSEGMTVIRKVNGVAAWYCVD